METLALLRQRGITSVLVEMSEVSAVRPTFHPKGPVMMMTHTLRSRFVIEVLGVQRLCRGACGSLLPSGQAFPFACLTL